MEKFIFLCRRRIGGCPPFALQARAQPCARRGYFAIAAIFLMNSDCGASGQLTPPLLDSLSPTRLGWRSHCSGLRSGIDRCVRSHSGCYRSRTHFKACLHKARSHHCPCQEHRREQAYDGDQTRVARTLAVDSGRYFIPAHDPHSLKSFEAHFFNNLSTADPTKNHRALPLM